MEHWLQRLCHASRREGRAAGDARSRLDGEHTPVVQVDVRKGSRCAAQALPQAAPCAQGVPVHAQNRLRLERRDSSGDGLCCRPRRKLAPAALLVQAAPHRQAHLRVRQPCLDDPRCWTKNYANKQADYR